MVFITESNTQVYVYRHVCPCASKRVCSSQLIPEERQIPKCMCIGRYALVQVFVVVVVVLLFYVLGKHLRSCRDGQLT